MPNNKSIYDYANKIDNDCLTYYDVFKTLFKDVDCVICLESAADLLVFSNGGFRSQIKIYVESDIDKPYLNCILVDKLENIPYEDYQGLKVSSINDAIIDMLSRKNTDDQILYETFANYYYENNCSYEGLEISENLIKKAQKYKNEAIKFYES